MKALIVVDAQNDFMPGGALPVPNGNEIIPVVNELVKKYDLVIFTQDWHPSKHSGFASEWNKQPFETLETERQGIFHSEMLWPDHCVQNTPGADIHSDIKFENCKGQYYIFKKGEDYGSQGYSAFETKELASFLDGKGVNQLVICGLATDYCVKNTAVDAKEAGFNVTVWLPACKSIAEYNYETVRFLTENDIKIEPDKDAKDYR